MVSRVDLKLEERRFVSEYQKVAFEMRDSSNLASGAQRAGFVAENDKHSLYPISESTCKKNIYEKI